MKSNLTEPQFNILITIPKDPGRGEAVDETPISTVSSIQN